MIPPSHCPYAGTAAKTLNNHWTNNSSNSQCLDFGNGEEVRKVLPGVVHPLCYNGALLLLGSYSLDEHPTPQSYRPVGQLRVLDTIEKNIGTLCGPRGLQVCDVCTPVTNLELLT